MFRSVYSVSLCCSVYCLCVNVYCAAATIHNEELHELYSSPTVVRVIKSRRMRWAGHVARKGEGRRVYRVLDGKRQLEKPRRI
jgi:DNA-binding transcriptional regulator PaaX